MIRTNLFDYKQLCNCHLIVEDNFNKLQFTGIFNFDFKDTATIDIITLDKIDKSYLAALVFTSHEHNLNEISVPLTNDGSYNITHIIMPTIDWYYKEKDKKYNKLSKYKEIYITDNKSIYRIENNTLVEVDPLDLTLKDSFDQTTIIKDQSQIFLTCYLKKCYLYLCNKIIAKLINSPQNVTGHNIGTCLPKDIELQDWMYRRDLVWLTLKVIGYLLLDNKFTEAQQILEDVQRCNGLCINTQDTSESNFIENDSTGTIYNISCGCGK